MHYENLILGADGTPLTGIYQDLAQMRRFQKSLLRSPKSYYISSKTCFSWGETPEGTSFWSLVNLLETPSVPKDEKCNY